MTRAMRSLARVPGNYIFIVLCQKVSVILYLNQSTQTTRDAGRCLRYIQTVSCKIEKTLKRFFGYRIFSNLRIPHYHPAISLGSDGAYRRFSSREKKGYSRISFKNIKKNYDIYMCFLYVLLKTIKF